MSLLCPPPALAGLAMLYCFSAHVGGSLSGAQSLVASVPSPRTVPFWSAAEPPGNRERAETAFDEGERAYAAGDYEAAVERFADAQALVPHPFTAYNLGLALTRAGRTLEAWEMFDRLSREAEDPEHRQDAREQRALLRSKVAMVRVDADANAVVCLDGRRLSSGEARVVLPGAHRVEIDARRTPLDLQGGETMHLDARRDRNGHGPRHPAVRPLLGVAIGSGVVAVATGLGPLFTENRNAELGLGMTAGVAATVAVVTTIAALALHNRGAEPTKSAPAGTTQPGCG